MRVRDIMIKNVPPLKPEMSLGEAVHMLIESGYSGLPVVDEEGRVEGIVTEADALTFLEFLDLPGKDEFSDLSGYDERVNFVKRKVRARSGKLVAHVMNQTPILCTPLMKIDDLAELMIDKAVRLVPVVDNGILVGIVTRREIIELLIKPEKVGEGG
jgi:CBS domain-containing protein